MDKNAILVELSASDRVKFGRQDFSEQSRPQKVFSSVWALESEVNNGGFSQYFQNSSVETAPFVAQALDAIGAPRTADICRRAIRTAFPSGLPSDGRALHFAAGLPEDVLEKLEELDSEFLAYPHNLTDLLFAYVGAHSDEFGDVPRPCD